MATYSVMNVLLSLATLGGGRADRARPKSQSCRSKTEQGHATEKGGREPRQDKTDLEVAVGVEEEVGRLQVSMEDVGRVKGFESAEGLE